MKPLRYILPAILSCMLTAMGQDIASLQREAEKLENTHQEEALKKYYEILRVQPTNVNALVKTSQLCSGIGHRQTAKTSKLEYFKAAKRYAELSLKLAPANSEANFAMAIATGRLAMVMGGKEKIEAVNDIRKYAELAIKYDASNYKAWHVLGKWHYEVSDLNAFERAAAKIFYGGIPEASLKQSIVCYEKSRSLSPDFILNYLELAKAYHRNDQDARAIELLRKLAIVPAKMQDDQRIKNEGKKLLEDLQ